MAKRRRRIRFRPPGVKPGGKVGPWGPFRGRLGAQWWIASIVVGLVLLAFTAWFFLRGTRPPPPWQPVATVDEIQPGEAIVRTGGVVVGRLEDGRPVAVRQNKDCPVEHTESRLRDCEGNLYFLNGDPETTGAEPLEPVPVQVYRGEVYVRP